MLMTAAKKEAVENIKTNKDNKNLETNLTWILYIQYSIIFWKKSILTFFGLSNKVKAIYPTFAKELGFSVRHIDVVAQKIVSTMLDSNRIVVAAFSLTNKANWIRFFEETILVPNVRSERVLEMFFLILSNADVDFLDQKFRWRTYII